MARVYLDDNVESQPQDSGRIYLDEPSFLDKPELTDEQKKQSKSVLVQGIRSLYDMGKSWYPLAKTITAKTMPYGKEMLEKAEQAPESQKLYKELESIPEPEGFAPKLSRIGTGMLAELPLFAAGGYGVSAIKFLNAVRNPIVRKALSSSLTFSGITGAKTSGMVAQKQITPTEALVETGGSALTGAVFGVGSKPGEKIAGSLAKRLAPEYTKLATKLGGSASAGGVFAGLSPEGQRIPAFVFGSVLHGVSPETDPRMEMAKSVQDNIKRVREKAVKPLVAGKNTLWQQDKYSEDFNKIADRIIQDKGNFQYTDRTGNLKNNKLPEDVKDFADHIDAIRKEAGQKMSEIAQAEGAKGAYIDTNKVISSVLNPILNKRTTPKEVRIFTEELKNELLDVYGKGKPMTISEAQEKIAQWNNDLRPYYQSGRFGAGTAESVLKQTRDVLRNELNDTVENSRGNKDYENARKMYSAAKNVLSDALHRKVVSDRYAPKGLFDLTDVFATGEMVKGGIRILGGDVLGGGADVVKAGAMHGIKQHFKNLNSPDFIIKDAFKKIDANIEDIEKLSIHQKTFSDILQQLKLMPRDARVEVLKENPEFTNDMHQLLLPYFKSEYKPVGEKQTSKFKKFNVPEFAPEVVAGENPVKKLPKPGMIYGQSFVATPPKGKGGIVPESKAQRTSDWEGAGLKDPFIKELWVDISDTLKSEKGEIQSGFGEKPFEKKNNIPKAAEEAIKKGMTAEDTLPTSFLRNPKNMVEGFNIRESGDLVGYGKDAPKGTWEDFKKSIKEEGIKKPIEIYVDKKGKIEIIEGTHRILAAEELGIKNIPYIARGNVDKLNLSEFEKAKEKVQKETEDKPKNFIDKLEKSQILKLFSLAGAGLVSNATEASAALPKDEDAINAILGEVGPYGFQGMLWVASAIRNRNKGLQGVYGHKNPNVVNKKYTKKQYEQAKKAWELSKEKDYSLGAMHWFSDADLKQKNVQRIIKEENLEFIASVGHNNFYKKKKR